MAVLGRRNLHRMPRPPEDWFMYYDNLGDEELESTDGYWSALKEDVTDFFDNVESSAGIVDRGTVAYLRNMAEVERGKEVLLLTKYLGCTQDVNKDMLDSDLIALLTEALSIKEEAIKLQKAIQKDDLTASFQYASPKMVGSYIATEIAKNINALSYQALYDALVNDDDAQFEKEWNETIVSPSVRKGLEEFTLAMERDKRRAGKSGAEKWGEIVKLLQRAEDFGSNIVSTAYQQYGLANVKRWMEEAFELEGGGTTASAIDKVKERTMRNIRIDIAGMKPTKKDADRKKRGRIVHTAAGLMAEEFGVLIKELTIGNMMKKNGINMKYDMKTAVAGGGYSTDLVTKITPVGVEANLTAIEKSASTKKEAYRQFTNFADSLERAQDTALIYESTKLYGMKNFESFHGSTMTFDSAGYLFEEIGYEKARDLLLKIAQTAKGALYGGEGRVLQKDAGLILSQYIAYFLFDDWKSIGKDPKGGPNVIHVFNLNFFIVPLSFLLFKLADAIDLALKDTSAQGGIDGYVQIAFKPAEVKYTQYPQRKKSQSESEKRWLTQMEMVKRGTVHVQFLQNFKDLIRGNFDKVKTLQVKKGIKK